MIFLPAACESCGYTCHAHLHGFRSSQSPKALITSPGSRAVLSWWGKSDEAACAMSICMSIMAVRRPNISYWVFGLNGSVNAKRSLSLRFSFLWLHMSIRQLVAEELPILYMGDLSHADKQENVSCFTVNILPSKAMFCISCTFRQDLSGISYSPFLSSSHGIGMSILLLHVRKELMILKVLSLLQYISCVYGR